MKTVLHAVGTYVPRYRITSEEIARAHGRDADHARGLGVTQKAVGAPDEDAFTMAVEAARSAIGMCDIDPKDIGAVYVGSESHPYAVKPTSGMVAHAVGADRFCRCADLEFACKAGTAALQIVASMAGNGDITYGLAIGSDTAQAAPGDMLEYTAAAGAAAVLAGRPSKTRPGLCSIDATLSYTTDTPDFWRAAGSLYPAHAGRFTGDPGYFHHIETAAQRLLEKCGITPEEPDHVVLHMPNAKFPTQAAQRLGFSKEQLAAGFIVPAIGNTYSACSLLGLASVLETAKKDERILLVSYGSGAGADAFLFTMLRDGEAAQVSAHDPIELSYTQYMAHAVSAHA